MYEGHDVPRRETETDTRRKLHHTAKDEEISTKSDGRRTGNREETIAEQDRIDDTEGKEKKQ